MKKLFLIDLTVLSLLAIFTKGVTTVEQRPTLLSVQGLNQEIFHQWRLNIFDPILIGSFIFLVFVNLFFLLREEKALNSYYQMMLYRTSKEDYFIKRIVQSSYAVLKQIGILAVANVIVQSVFLKKLQTITLLNIVSDGLYLVKFMLLLFILTMLYELLPFTDMGNSVIYLYLMVIMLLFFDIFSNAGLISHVSEVSLNLFVLGINLLVILLILGLLYRNLKRGDIK